MAQSLRATGAIFHSEVLDVADAFAFTVSQGATRITDAVLPVDGCQVC